MENYFTNEEVGLVQFAMSDMSKVGINIASHGDIDEQRRAFFDKAKLWTAICKIISVLYIKGLASGLLKLHDTDGNEYGVVKIIKEEGIA
jgi:hypothetical protein